MQENVEKYCWSVSRRGNLQTAAAVTAGQSALQAASQSLARQAQGLRRPERLPQLLDMRLMVDCQRRNFTDDVRTTLLDARREQLQLSGTTQDCRHGWRGACVVLVDGQRINASLTTLEVLAAKRSTASAPASYCQT